MRVDLNKCWKNWGLSYVGLVIYYFCGGKLVGLLSSWRFCLSIGCKFGTVIRLQWVN